MGDEADSDRRPPLSAGGAGRGDQRDDRAASHGGVVDCQSSADRAGDFRPSRILAAFRFRLNGRLASVSVPFYLKQRLAYYACSLYSGQLQRGGDYLRLRPAYSICLLCEVLFSNTSAPHHRFRLADTERDQVLLDTVEVHTVELTKNNLDEASITRASPVEKWAFFLLCADRYEGDRLRELLPGSEFQEAISIAETIREKTEDRLMYDQREKAQRDYLWAIEGARKKALKEGWETGYKEGREEGREEGRREGELVGKIELLRQLLGEVGHSKAELENCSLEELRAIAADLQERLRSRGDSGNGSG